MRYIYTGETVVPKNCKYGPRPAEGVVFNDYEWWSITDHLVKEQREREMAAVYRAKEDAKKEISFDMTQNWSNTLASIKTQGNQKRIEKREKEKQDKIDQYNQILKTWKEEKKEIVEGVRKILYEDKDEVKTINSAVLLSLVLDGRKKQIELKNKLKEEENRKILELGAKFRKDAEEFAKEKLEEKIGRNSKKKIQRQFLDEQMAEIRQRRQEELEEFEEEKKDMVNMRIEGEKIHHCNMVEKKYRKEFAAKYIQKTQSQLEHERNLKLEEEEENEINNLYIKFDRRFKKERKEREEKARNDQVQRRIKIAEKLAEGLMGKAKAEEDRMEAAIKEKEAEALREQESKERMRKNALADILQSKKMAEERRAREQQETKEAKKWEMMQAYKSMEVTEEWREAERRRKRENQAATRAGYDQQVKDLQERRAKELYEWEAPLEDLTKDKEELLRYCEGALEFTRENNLPEYPVQVAITNVKKANGLWTETGQQQQQQVKEQSKGGEGCGARKPKQAPMRSGCYCLKY